MYVVVGFRSLHTYFAAARHLTAAGEVISHSAGSSGVLADTCVSNGCYQRSDKALVPDNRSAQIRLGRVLRVGPLTIAVSVAAVDGI